MTKIICIAGFGDDASMFDALGRRAEATLQFVPLNLPGFGAPPLSGEPTSLNGLAAWLAEQTLAHNAETVLAHSVASIIASMAAAQPGSPIRTILSLEGNLTAEDAYFSGSAAQFPSADIFKPAFLARLDEMASGDPVLARYRAVVEQADRNALWELGCDAHAFSAQHSPGTLLMDSARSVYLFNPDNLPETSLAWLNSNPLARYELPGASHWASVDQPALLKRMIATALSALET